MEKKFVIVQERLNLEIATTLTSSGFVVPESESLMEDVRNHLAKGEMYTATLDGEIIGYAIFLRITDDILYLAGMMIHPSAQGRGLCQRFINEARLPTDTFFALRTQSPIMWAAGHTYCRENWYPLNNEQNDEELSSIAQYVAQQIGCRSAPVSVGFYGSALYGVQPRHHNQCIQSWWESICDFDRGDAVVCVGRLSSI